MATTALGPSDGAIDAAIVTMDMKHAVIKMTDAAFEVQNFVNKVTNAAFALHSSRYALPFPAPVLSFALWVLSFAPLVLPFVAFALRFSVFALPFAAPVLPFAAFAFRLSLSAVPPTPLLTLARQGVALSGRDGPAPRGFRRDWHCQSSGGLCSTHHRTSRVFRWVDYNPPYPLTLGPQRKQSNACRNLEPPLSACCNEYERYQDWECGDWLRYDLIG